MKPQFRVWARCFPHQFRASIAMLLAGIGFAGVVFLAQAFGIDLKGAATLAIIPTAFSIRSWLTLRHHFAAGDTVPGVVVSIHPPLVAYYTDLTHRLGDPWPAIKIVPAPLEKIRTRTLRAGDRVAGVALYYGTQSLRFWSNFDPILADCVTDRLEDVQRLHARLDAHQEAWPQLAYWLAHVPRPLRPGIHLMRNPASSSEP